MHCPHYRHAARCAVWLLAAPGCTGADPVGPMSTETRAQPSVADDSASREPRSELETVLAAIISKYDTQVDKTCPCFVEQGTYADMDECVMWLGSRPDWLGCATEALQKYDNPEAIEDLRCVESEAQATLDCLEKVSCDSPERESCFASPLKCLADQIDLVLDLDRECPDFSLLPRETARDMSTSP